MKKNIITNDSVRETLVSATKANLHTLAFTLPIMLVIFVPMICLCLSMAFDEEMHILGNLIFGLLFTPIMASLPLYFLFQLKNELWLLKMLNEYRFSILKDTVTRTETIIVRRHEEYVAHFENYGKCNISRTQYDLTSAKDEYYLVILDCTQKILNAYPTITNEYNEK